MGASWNDGGPAGEEWGGGKLRSALGIDTRWHWPAVHYGYSSAADRRNCLRLEMKARESRPALVPPHCKASARQYACDPLILVPFAIAFPYSFFGLVLN